MARKFGPFDTSPFYEVENRRLQRAFNPQTGFVKTGQGAVTAGTGAELVIAAYPDGALIDGLYVENAASETVTLTTNTASTNPRIDRLVMRLDMGAQTIAPFQIVGTPGASPQAPPLVQTATVFDMPLCQYRFPGSVSAQNPGSIVDERLWQSNGPERVALADGWYHWKDQTSGPFDRLQLHRIGNLAFLHGQIGNTSSLAASVTATIVAAGGIPAAYRPTANTAQRVVAINGGLTQRIDVLPNGGLTITPNTLIGAGAFHVFDVSWPISNDV